MALPNRIALGVVVAGVLMSQAGAALAVDSSVACCMSDPNTSPKAMSGLGQSAPLAANVSQLSAWNVFKFQRDGITYLQVNDRSGKVRVTIGNVDETFWALPVGTSSDRVSVPGKVLSIPAGSRRAEVYNNGFMVLAAYESAGGILWSIEAPDGTR